MSRGLGEVELLGRLPDAASAVAGLVTQLGDVWFLFVVVGVLALVDARRRSLAEAAALCAYLFALTIAASSLTVVLKHAFALPRPPEAATATRLTWLPVAAESAYEATVTATGYGFPSGHALTTTVVYGGAALASDASNRNRRLLLAGTVITLVAVSRVVIGVHYAVDVAVGVALGVTLLGGVTRLIGKRPTPALVLATGLAALAAGVSGATDAGLALSNTVVALAAWVGADRFWDLPTAVVEG